MMPTPRKEQFYVVTGTYHGAWVLAESEGQARRLFHLAHNGESIIYMRDQSGKVLQGNKPHVSYSYM